MTRNRSGYSLVETLVVATISMLVLTSIAVSLHWMFRVDRDIRSDFSNGLIMRRFSQQFREDTHGALRGSVDPANPRLLTLLAPGEQRFEYEIEGDSVLRRRIQNDQVVQRERFRFSNVLEIRWTMVPAGTVGTQGRPDTAASDAAASEANASDASRPLIRCVLSQQTRPGEVTEDTTRVAAIDGALGIDFPVSLGGTASLGGSGR